MCSYYFVNTYHASAVPSFLRATHAFLPQDTSIRFVKSTLEASPPLSEVPLHERRAMRERMRSVCETCIRQKKKKQKRDDGVRL
jgi:hypothetical protein